MIVFGCTVVRDCAWCVCACVCVCVCVCVSRVHKPMLMIKEIKQDGEMVKMSLILLFFRHNLLIITLTCPWRLDC